MSSPLLIRCSTATEGLGEAATAFTNGGPCRHLFASLSSPPLIVDNATQSITRSPDAMKSFGKPRIASGGASSPARRSAAFGGFSSSSSSLSYVAEPPDLSGISVANVVVSFKNLQKKDETTKAKALEDLVANVQEHPFELHGGVEDAVLDAWVRFSPGPCEAGALRF